MRTARLVACALSCAGFACVAGAQLVRVPHTFVSLSPPPGFTATRGIGGFENRRAGWVIEVLEVGADLWPHYTAAFSSPANANAAFGAAMGIRVERIEQLVLDSGEIPLALGQSGFGRGFVTYTALMGDRRANPVFVTFGLRRSSALDRSDVEAVLRSVKIDTPTTLAEWLTVLPFTFREVPPFHTTRAESGPTRASDGFASLAASEDADQSAKTLTILIRWTPTDIPAESAQTNASLLRGLLNGGEIRIVEQRAVGFAGGPGDFIVASADGRTAFQFLRVLPDHTQVRFSVVGESRAMQAAREALMDIAMSVEPRER
jgi:hypothetical protein